MTLFTVALVLEFALLTPLTLALGLSACIGKYPDYDGNIDISDGSKVTVRFSSKKDMVVKFHARGAEADCVNCGVHIHSGTTCDDANNVGGHYWDADGGTVTDPWTPDNGAVYNTDSEGMGDAMYSLNSGYTLEENVDHAVVVHDQKGDRIGCGLLSKGRKAAELCMPTRTVLQACITKYPDYNGDLDILGKVRVRFQHENMRFRYKLKGAHPNCKECGTHIHSGTTCDDADLVGGHYWDNHNGITADPWNTANGAIYTTNSDGFSTSKFYFNAGFDAEENVGHAVVVHDEEGIRYGCGVLSAKKATGCFLISE